MKRLVIGDLHIGKNEKDTSFLSYQDKSLEWIIDVANSNDCVCDFLGDVFDNTNSISHIALDRFNNFISRLNHVGNFIVGNHDCHYRQSNHLNSLSLLLENFNVVVDDVYEENDICYIPWINKNNSDKLLSQLDVSECKYCFGHLELVGFLMRKNYYSERGQVSLSSLRNFDNVISGHYHVQSEKGNIFYLGTPYQQDMSDVGLNKYIMIFDTDTGEYELIQNPYEYFVTVDINNEDDLSEIDSLTDKKVNVNLNCDRNINIQSWLSNLEESNSNMKVNDNFTLNLDSANVDVENFENILEMWDEYIGSIEDLSDKSLINSIFYEEYEKGKE